MHTPLAELLRDGEFVMVMLDESPVPCFVVSPALAVEQSESVAYLTQLIHTESAISSMCVVIGQPPPLDGAAWDLISEVLKMLLTIATSTYLMFHCLLR